MATIWSSGNRARTEPQGLRQHKRRLRGYYKGKGTIWELLGYYKVLVGLS